MNYLFRRLTGMFWFLFLGVICAFGINFYSRYEENYKQKLIDFEVVATQQRDEINQSIIVYEKLIDESISMFQVYYEDNHNYFESLTTAQLESYQSYEGLSHVTFSNSHHLVATLALKKTNAQLNRYLKLTYKYYTEDYPIMSIKFIPDLSIDMPTHLFASEEQQHLYYYLIDKQGKMKDFNGYMWKYVQEDEFLEINNQYSTVFKAVKIENEIYGYITLEIDKSTLADTFQIFLKDKLIYIKELFGDSTADEKEEIRALIAEADVSQIEELLTKRGNIVRKLSTTDDLIDVYQYIDKETLHNHVLTDTFRLFELNLIILIILFLSVSYILFISIIKPCYLLIEYVKQCGEGNYNIPSSITNEWRHPFMTIRNAYLDNERLLALKENQSQELEYAWKKAMVANQAKTHFLAKVSHELKTPLNAIKGYIQLLKLTVDDEKHLKKINIIERSSDLLLNIVTELLDFSRIEEGKIKLIISEINIIHIGEMLEGFFINDMEAKQLDYEVTVDHLIPISLFGDENRIKQIIINLISNAIKFTNHGKINVIFKLDNIDRDYAYIEVRVNDTGKGIAPEKLDAIFESFTQENNSISRKYGGTGLGLSISKGLAEVMGGSLTVESEVGVGSTFTFFLPLALNPIDEEEN